MDYTQFMPFVTFIGGGSLVASFVTGILKKAFKDVNDRYGALITQALLFVVSAGIAALITASPLIPAVWLMLAGQIFLGAMFIYEVLYKAILQQLIMGNTSK